MAVGPLWVNHDRLHRRRTSNDVRSCPDIVAKLDAALRTRNNRIQSGGVLNQRCALVPILESTLRILVAKIVLQQYRPESGQKFAAAGAGAMGQNRIYAVQQGHLSPALAAAARTRSRPSSARCNFGIDRRRDLEVAKRAHALPWTTQETWQAAMTLSPNFHPRMKRVPGSSGRAASRGILPVTGAGQCLAVRKHNASRFTAPERVRRTEPAVQRQSASGRAHRALA